MTSRNLSRSRTLHWNYSHLNNFVASKFIFLFLLFLFFLFFYFVLFVVEWTQKWSTMAWKRKRIIAVNSLSNSNKNNEIRVFFAFVRFHLSVLRNADCYRALRFSFAPVLSLSFNYLTIAFQRLNAWRWLRFRFRHLGRLCLRPNRTKCISSWRLRMLKHFLHLCFYTIIN